MRRAWTETSRAAEVRGAARGWADAKAIDAPTLVAIESAYPDSRIALHPVWRVLVFVAACVAIFALHFGLFQKNLDGLGPTTAAAAALMLATEWLRGSRASGTGVDAATSFLAWMFALIAAFVLFDDEWKIGNDASLNLLFGFSFVLAALFAWRWGFWAFAAVSAASAFLLAARLPAGRANWAVLSLVLLVGTDRIRDRASIAPPHRRSLGAVFVVSAAALYGAVNLYAMDHFWIEAIRVLFHRPPEPPPLPPALRLLASLATAAFPVVFLAWGIRSTAPPPPRDRDRLGGSFGHDLAPLRTDRPALGLAHRVRRRPHRGRALGAPAAASRGRRCLAGLDRRAPLRLPP